MKNNLINFDSSDWTGLRDLMKHHNDFKEMLFGKKEDGEKVN